MNAGGSLIHCLLSGSPSVGFRHIAQDANVTISIYNVKGRLIRVLHLGEQKAVIYVSKDRAAYWDGRDSAGETVGSGVYFYTLQVGDFKATRRMVILKTRFL